MAAARVSFVTPPPSSTDSGESSPASSVITLDETELSELTAILDNTAYLVLASERLQLEVGIPLAGHYSKVFFATIDGDSQSSRNVAVKRIRDPSSRYSSSSQTLEIAKLIQVWKDLKHPNVLGLLGYTLNHENEIDQLISPYIIHGNIQEFLNKAVVGVAQRLEFVRDITAGLDYLHSQTPPICHGNIDPHNVLIDGDLNAILTNWGPSEIVGASSDRYASPEIYIGKNPAVKESRDVWSWGCVAFKIITDTPPYNRSEGVFSILQSMINREAPGKLDMLLALVPDAPKPEYASTLRLLHSYLPLCWDYEPRKRPPISLLRRQAFMFSFEDDAGDSVVATLEELAYLLIPPNRLRIVERSELGAGNYGEVVLGTLDGDSSTPRDVAVKRLKAIGTRGERVRLAKRLARELNIWAKIKHPNVVELIGYYLDEKYESPLLISALMTNGNVLNYIERIKPDIERRIAFVKGITAGLACLHTFDPAICHADLKPANVLIDLQMNAVLCDFGLASFVSGSGTSPGLVTSTTIKGTPRYMSPELLLESDCTHSLESDVWAWACTVFQVLTGLIPYAEVIGEAPFYMAIAQGKLPGDIAVLLPNDAERVDSESAPALRFLCSTLPQCWDFDPQNRPSICRLLWHISDLSPRTEAEASGNADVASSETQTWQNLANLSSRQEGAFDGNEGVAPGDLEEGTKLADTPGDPSGNCAEVESTEGDKENAHPDGEGTNEENPGLIEDEPRVKGDSKGAQLEDGKTAPPATSDHSSPKISPQPLSMLILAAVCILSLSVNIFQFLRKVDPLPLQNQDASRPTYQERDL